jgi:hypothetical protein
VVVKIISLKTEMLILLDCVVIITSSAIVLYLLLSYQQTQRALIWWNSRQWLKMYQEGEAIQNGLLQESFVIRRHLEISSVDPSFCQQEQEQYYLATMEKFHNSLKELSDYLSPAHIDDSLPLAIQYLLVKWESRIPGLNLQMKLPNEWHHELLFTSRCILLVLEELLQMTSSIFCSTLSIFVSLETRENFHELKVKLTDLKTSKQIYISNLPESDYLRRAFIFSTFGECFYEHDDAAEIWHFQWKSLDK